MPPKKQTLLPFVALASGSRQPATGKTLPTSSLSVVEILDIKFAEGKKYYIRTVDGTQRWVSHRQLKHVPHLIAAFHERQQQVLSHILDSGRRPDRLCGLVTEPLTGQLQFVTKWHGRDECHLVSADQMYAKHPQLAIRYLLGLVRVREFEPTDVSRVAERLDAMDADAAADADAPILTAFDSTRVAQEILGTIHYGGQQMFLMKWTDSSTVGDFVLADEASQRCPRIVIRYLESLIVRRPTVRN